MTTSLEPVPRMPSVRQVSTTVTSGAFIGTPKCSTLAGVSPSRIALVINRSPASAPEVKTFRAVIL